MTALARELIRKKRDGERLSWTEVESFVGGVATGGVTDDQAAAMLMAIFFRGLDEAELAAWTQAMLASGEVMDLSDLAGRKVDKHSTGGVGDKISLPLAPAVAACGVVVPMLSGRGLGHTGGTLDKLEAIPGYQTQLSGERFREVLRDVGCCIIGQSESIVPADRKLYALRDVTATVESIPLIASSIMSKKLAEGIDALVLDVKVGSGAFMKGLYEARTLARTMLGIGRASGKQVTAVLTSMEQPIGDTVGNSLEVIESIECLRGRGPADTRALTITLGAEMLLLGGHASTPADAAHRMADALDSGRALETFRRMVEAQGGDPRVCDEPERVLPMVTTTEVVTAPTAGVLARIDSEEVGMAALVLGAGRRRQDDAVDFAVGLTVHARLGDRLERGQPLVTLHHRDGHFVEDARRRILMAYTIGDDPAQAPPLVHEILRP